jgi:hypothetical protein
MILFVVLPWPEKRSPKVVRSSDWILVIDKLLLEREDGAGPASQWTALARISGAAALLA